MANKFIIIFNNASKEQQDIITQRLTKTTYPYWHWLENVWLITTGEDISPQSFTQWLEKTPGIDNLTYVVFRIDGACPYWGRNDKEAWNWMNRFWGPPGN